MQVGSIRCDVCEESRRVSRAKLSKMTKERLHIILFTENIGLPKMCDDVPMATNISFSSYRIVKLVLRCRLHAHLLIWAINRKICKI
jgi:hypothetical protein